MKLLSRLWEIFITFWKRKHLTQIGLLIILVVFLITISYFGWLASRANVQSLQKGLSQPTVIYDKDGDVASNVATNRTNGASIKELPRYVPNAIVAIEDERFYQHGGFDIRGMARAFLGNLFAGHITEGGSTLTQQLAKNALLSSERTYKRKLEELFLSVKLEQVYTKDQILQMYMNQVYFGSGAWGINNAARKYFDKPAKDLTISEAAMVAGLLHAPTSLDPYQHYNLAMQRRNVVLAKMKDLGMITNAQYITAKSEKLQLHDGGGSTVDRKYPYYVDAVLDEAISKYGLTQDEILTRGYRIYTEMDQNIQSGLESVYNNNSLFPSGMGGKLVQSGAVLMDPATGGVRALVGGRGEHVFRGYNRATQLTAQPGSTIKPLAVYTPALEKGYNYNSMLVDKPLSIDNYKPENYNKTYLGQVPMYKAVEESMNVPAVWLLNKIGLNTGLDSLKRFGIPFEKADENLAIALGGMSTGISPLQLADAFSTFPNGGVREDGHLITKIVGPTGNIIAERKPQTTKVTSKSVANAMTSMLLNVVETGTGRLAHIPGVQIAGKTGSTQLPFAGMDGTKDQWMAGYTTDLVGAIWIGYDQTDREHYLPSNSSTNVVPIFKEIMNSALPYTKHKDFEVDSINTQMAKGGDPQKAIQEQAAKISKELNDNAKIISEKIQEQAPAWRRGFDQAMNNLGKGVNMIVEKLQKLKQ